jgi:ATP-dependent helicase/nuclease subunit A
MDNHIALNPSNSIVVEACAGSGKTWLLVSRIVRLLLAGVQPGEILAITFTRKAAQEMQERLHEWLHFLAAHSDEDVCEFLKERAIDICDETVLAKARGLYRDFLLSSSSITISTFHGWFMQIIQRAPLNAGVPVGLQLLERTTALREEAWDALADGLHAEPKGDLAQEMQWLFNEIGLHNTRNLLESFLHKRAEWWAYTQGRDDAVEWALQELQNELEVDWNDDPYVDMQDEAFALIVQTFTSLLASGSDAQQRMASTLDAAMRNIDLPFRYQALFDELHTAKGEARKLKANKGQNIEQYANLFEGILQIIHHVQDSVAERAALRLNQAGLRCGDKFIKYYQELKLRQQVMDFTDVEYPVARLMKQSDSAEYMQYKLDSRYKQVLLDEFQDTNPLQWQILQAWFEASVAAGEPPKIFIVGDPKQSIYRFRRADARLFGEVSNFMQQEFGAHYLTQNETRRNAAAVLNVVNGVFATHPEGFVDFENHLAHHKTLPGHIAVLPLNYQTKLPPLPSHPQGVGRGCLSEVLAPSGGNADKSATSTLGEGWGGGASDELPLRNPLLQKREEDESGAREAEAEQFATTVGDIVAHWSVQDAHGKPRRASFGDIMVLVRKRTHLRIYEAALRKQSIPFLTSRRGGLLQTLEAEDLQALLTFLITPFADLQLAQALRSPMFSCSDADLMQLASVEIENPDEMQEEGKNAAPHFGKGRPGGISSWWVRLKYLATGNNISPALQRAHQLLHDWLQRVDKLPVHDLLDHIYFSADVPQRYAAAVPEAMRATVQANLQALLEVALEVDGGRYPSLPRFLAELRELREAENESPDEGKVGEVGNALRIYTVHEAKGLEAPIVWLLDANDTRSKNDGYGVLIDWPTNAARPAHFSLFGTKTTHGKKRQQLFEAEEEYTKREGMNLLYVAITRAKQVLLVSGNGRSADTEQKKNTLSWYDRIAQVVTPVENPLLQKTGANSIVKQQITVQIDQALQRTLPTGKRVATDTIEQQRGTWLHAMLQILTTTGVVADQASMQIQCGIPGKEMDALWQQAQTLLSQPELQRYFDASLYQKASNEMPYVNAQGEMKRIDRLVEFDNEVWVLDYKTGTSHDAAPYRAQMAEYRSAMQGVYVNTKVRCALVFTDGLLVEI